MNDNSTELRARLDPVLEKIKPASVRAVMSEVFESLADLLECVDLLEVCVKSDDTLLKVNHVFRFINRQSQTLIGYIETSGKSAPGITEELCDLLDGTIFAIQHELQRSAVVSNPADNEPVDDTRSKFMRAYGLLRNCFQQCVLSLATAIEPSVRGPQIFKDFTLLREQSLVLVEALTVLTQQANHAEEERDLDSYFSLTEGLKVFRQGYMQYLLYRDWAQFDAFSDKIFQLRTESELWPIVEQFARYLETLLGHVKMREVLQNHMLEETLAETVAQLEGLELRG